MKWIGLTGSIGSGKSTVAKLLLGFGYTVIDADAVAHEGLKSGSTTYFEIINHFGKSILNSEGEINRRELGKLIFSNENEKKWLENLIHPMVQMRVQEMKRSLELKKHKIAFYEVPLIFEKNLMDQFDRIVVVWVSELVQKDRLKLRNNWTDLEIKQRIDSQWPVTDKIRKSNFTINNDGSLDELKIKVSDLIHKLKYE